MKTRQLPGWKRGTAWGIIALQLFSPLFFSFTPAAQAKEYADYRSMDETMAGLQALISEPRMLSHTLSPTVASQAQNNPPLPTLDMQAEEAVEPAAADAWLAPKVAQTGQLLMSEDVGKASADFARSVGGGLINQQLQDWVGQKGTVNATLDSDGNIGGDVLLPLHDTEDQLLFGQLGLRKNDERNITNIGLGYRQQIDAWMYGVNTFYDYDYTGKNARLGIGGEAWGNFLKLSANAYHRLTDWHPSTIEKMRDYDERPANGFDLRLDGWLPSQPQWGGSVKYERYFGKNIALTSSGDLKNDPWALTLGLNYSPFPLLTLSGERSFGDTRDTRFDLSMNYRLGVPLWRQLDADNLDIQRSLMGSRYALVDRNYNIVMQYRKQLLVALSIPQHYTVEAGSTLSIPVTVAKAKYGLKRIEWQASANFSVNGGSFSQPSMTALEVQVPAYAPSHSRAASASQDYVLTAIGVDEKGNRSEPVTTTLHVMRSSVVVDQLTLTPDAAQIADNQHAFTVKARIVNRDRQPLVGQRVAFRVSQLTDNNNVSAATLFTDHASDKEWLEVDTNNQGIAAVQLRSRVVGNGVLTAALRNGNERSARVEFIADIASARLTELTVLADNAVANGVQTNKLRATVTDRYGNPLASYPVMFSADNGATLVEGSPVLTDAQGQVMLSLTHTRAGISTVTANANNLSLSKTVTFEVDRATAHFVQSSVAQNALANGNDINMMQVRVADALGNPIPGMAIQFVPDSPVKVSPAQAVTDAQGEAQTALTSRRAGSFNAAANLVGTSHSARLTTTFLPDGNSAQLPDENLVISPDGAAANGRATNGVTATVVDAYDNPLSGVAVRFSVSSGATLAASAGLTDADGKVSTTVVSSTAGVYTVNATVNGSTISKSTLFVADTATARIDDAHLLVDTNNAVADGNAMNNLTAIVKDASGNILSGMLVKFTVSSGAALTTAQGVSDDDGKVSTSVTSLRAGSYTVTASVGTTYASKPVNFTGDVTTAAIASVVLDGPAIEKDANGTDSFDFRATVKDANGNAIGGVTVNWAQDKGSDVTITSQSVTDSAGVAVGTLLSTRAEAVNVQVAASLSNANHVNANKKVSFTLPPVLVHGTTINAVTGSAISGVTVKIFRSQGDAQPLHTIVSDSSGKYSLTLKQGDYFVEASLAGYITLETDLVASLLGVTDYTKNFVLSPLLNGKAARMVLTWDARPKDLDSHLFVPVGNSTAHVQYSSRKPAGADAELDVDNTQGYGPETITINRMHPGNYCYAVYRYSTDHNDISGAKVKLYLADGRSYDWESVNANGYLNDRVWAIVKFVVAQDGTVDVVPINKLFSGSNINRC